MFANTRAEIATALSTVSGVTGHALRPSVLGEGDAWPILSAIVRSEYGNAWAGSWRVLVLLPADEATAVTRTDDLFDDITDALAPLMAVDLVEPVLLQTEAGDRPALQFSGRSE